MSKPAQIGAKDHSIAPGVAQKFDAALALHRHGRLDKAEALYKDVLRRAPAHVETIYQLGLIANSRGRPARAIQLIERAATLAPERADILCDLGLLLKAARRFNEAAACHERVAGMMPGSAEALSNLGTTYAAWNKIDQAILALEKAAALGPGNGEIAFNLGNAYLAAHRLDEAETAFRAALERIPGHVRAHANLGNTLMDRGRLKDAIVAFRTALDYAPTDAEAHWNLGLALLASGDFARGWREYEWRRRLAGFAMRRFQIPAWDGAALGERTLLVHAEQGLGDTLQFVRYLPEIPAPADQVAFLCPQRLKPFLAANLAVAVSGTDDPLPRAELEAPLLSLPYLLGRMTPMAGTTYLTANPARSAAWRQRLPDEPQFRIGIAWQGNPHYRGDHRRTIPLGAFAPLTANNGARLVSLQLGAGLDQRDHVPWGRKILDFSPELDADGAFLDTAALIQSLDLVICSDTAIAHLAAALGREVWMILANVPDWRWGLDGETTPWYPSMRLFRAAPGEEFRDVFARVARALERRTS